MRRVIGRHPETLTTKRAITGGLGVKLSGVPSALHAGKVSSHVGITVGRLGRSLVKKHWVSCGLQRSKHTSLR